MSHLSVRPASEDEFSVIDSLLNLNISNPNEGIYKISATTFGNRTFSSSGGTWGSITGLISNQTDLQSALNAKQITGNYITALIGDGTASGPGSSALTLATVNANVGTFGSATQSTQITVNGKGLITAIANVTVTPAVGSITGLGTGVSTALGINVGSAGAFITFNGAGGTPSSLVGTNITGTASGLTAGNVTTNANLTGPITSVGNATSIASQTGTGTKFVVDTSPTIVTPTFTTNFTSPLWKPAADSTTAIQITKSDGSTSVITVDTTNARVGINATPDHAFRVVGDGMYTRNAANTSGTVGIFDGTITKSSGDYFTWNTGVRLNSTQGKSLLLGAGTAGTDYTIQSDSFLALYSNNAETARLDLTGSIQIGGTAARGTTAGTKRLDIFDGTAPAGTGANFFSIYSASGEGRMMDSLGNVTISTNLKATIDTTGLTANVGASTLYSVPSTGAGMYRVEAYVVETTAGSLSSTLPNVQIVFTDKDSNTSVTLDATPVLGVAGIGQTGALTANTVGTIDAGVVVLYVKASTTIQYQTVNYASNLAGMTYALHIKLEYLG